MLAVLQREKEDVQQEDVCFLSPPHYSSTVTRLIKGVACTYKTIKKNSDHFLDLTMKMTNEDGFHDSGRSWSKQDARSVTTVT